VALRNKILFGRRGGKFSLVPTSYSLNSPDHTYYTSLQLLAYVPVSPIRLNSWEQCPVFLVLDLP
jgi:hypothetical protein